jgi:hypothetical protein
MREPARYELGAFAGKTMSDTVTYSIRPKGYSALS